MQIVIDIPDEKYSRLPYIDIFSLREYIENGTVLPTGHGRLIDADTLYREIETEGWFDSDDEYFGGGLEDIVLNASTIIEADKED